jgi:hypothetical protein
MPDAHVVTGANRLKHAMKTLLEHWEVTKETWTDQVRRDFEDHHLAPIERAVDVALNGMQEIGEVLAKVRKDCSDPDQGW